MAAEDGPRDERNGVYVKLSLQELWELFRIIEKRQQRVELGLVVVSIVALGRYGGELIGRFVGS